MDYSVIEAFLIGRCGMTEEQAGWTSMAEYRMRCEGHLQEQREKWEIARWQMFLTMQMHPNIKPHQKAKTPQAWIAFPWEKKESKKVSAPPRRCKVTKRERDRLEDIFSATINKGK